MSGEPSSSSEVTRTPVSNLRAVHRGVGKPAASLVHLPTVARQAGAFADRPGRRSRLTSSASIRFLKETSQMTQVNDAFSLTAMMIAMALAIALLAQQTLAYVS
jgi:hypothetical protein